ncbi:MAG TPA: DSD1 family PLP-dependent enzyme [Pseudomonadales bacterium]
MKRRNLLLGAGGLTAAAAGGVLLWKPEDQGVPHDAYFSALNELLKREGPGRPVMVLDRARLDHNIDVIARSVGPDKTYRVVVKSLPSVELLRYVMNRAGTRALMVFHQPFLNVIARSFPDSDVLLGKPMPVRAAAVFYERHAGSGSAFDPQSQLQWLVDTPLRLDEYRSLARQLGTRLRINVEIDVGLHRGGVLEPSVLAAMLDTIASDPDHLAFAGLMGYEPHLTGLQATLSHPAVIAVLDRYRAFIAEAESAGYEPGKLTLNGAGSHTLRIYEEDRTMNDLSAGSGVVKPTDFDTFHLADSLPAAFIGAPVLKTYDHFFVPGEPATARLLEWWDPNVSRVHYIYGGYWKARYVSPAGIQEPFYHSTNQEPFTTSRAGALAVGDYAFLRPTQSERVLMQFGDLWLVEEGKLLDRWSVFHDSG